jgi:hypothetical protein
MGVDGMSRVTLFSLLLALLLGVGIRLWTDEHRDACAPYLSGDTKAQKSEWVVSGTREIEVSCNDWTARMPLRIQILCLLDVVLGVLFGLNALSDLHEWLAMRPRLRGMM